MPLPPSRHHHTHTYTHRPLNCRYPVLGAPEFGETQLQAKPFDVNDWITSVSQPLPDQPAQFDALVVPRISLGNIIPLGNALDPWLDNCTADDDVGSMPPRGPMRKHQQQQQRQRQRPCPQLIGYREPPIAELGDRYFEGDFVCEFG